MTTQMDAIVQRRYGGPDDLEPARVAVPEPGRGQVRVRVLACAVNLSDWEFLTGSPAYARTTWGLRRPRRQILGSDVVGVVDALGDDVAGVGLGDRVMADVVGRGGGFAQYACLPAAAAVVVPDELDDEVAACLPQAGGIAMSGTRGLVRGQRLLVNGAGGGSGTMAVQIAVAAGVHVTAVDKHHKLDWLRGLGADEVVDHERVDFASTGETWDRILDMVATRPARRVARALAPGGRYQAVGGRVRVLVPLLVGGLVYRRDGRRVGMLVVRSGRALTGEVAAAAVAGRVSPIVDDVVGLDGVAGALARTGRGEVRGKVVVRPDRP